MWPLFIWHLLINLFAYQKITLLCQLEKISLRNKVTPEDTPNKGSKEDHNLLTVETPIKQRLTTSCELVGNKDFLSHNCPNTF